MGGDGLIRSVRETRICKLMRGSSMGRDDFENDGPQKAFDGMDCETNIKSGSWGLARKFCVRGEGTCGDDVQGG